MPRTSTQPDLFGIQVYQDALIRYIELTDTPITIALQGEWGSGKTSLMNQLREALCDRPGAPYFPIWINTWQYSLMKTPWQAIMSILEGIINQIGSLNLSEQKWNESKKKIGGLFKKMAQVGTKVAVSVVGGDGSVADDLFGEGKENSDISALKSEIGRLVQDALAHDPSRRGFVFYIDDLDRIDPPVAVEILELLKNIFDLPDCVFVLAIDYDVVIKGLRSKFGELTERNEREFRAFFDKIIQLPFSMPVASYYVDTFLIDALKKIAFFSEDELSKPDLAETLSEVGRLSVGSNPRSLKRLSNTLALISIINDMMDAKGGNNTDGTPRAPVDTKSKTLNFALVCMQIAYPFIYNQLSEEPNFKEWNDSIAARLKLRPLTDAEKESLDAAEEFDDPWEKVLLRMCQKETHLSNRAFSVSGLLNKIAEMVNDDARLGETVSAILELSAVTNLKAFDGPKKVYKFNRDLSNYRYNGKEYSQKTRLVKTVVTDYLKAHPETTLEGVREAFRIRKNMVPIFMDWATYVEKREANKLGFFSGKLTEKELIPTADEGFFICTNWPTTSNGQPSYFMFFLDICKKRGIEITPC